MSTQHQQQILIAYPELALHDVKLDTSGQYNDVLIINGEYIFRFPRFTQEIIKMRTETRLLTWLQGKLPLAVPDPCFQHLDTPTPGEAFMGYRLIPGGTLTRQKLNTLHGQPAWHRMAAQFGEFLRALHALDLSTLSIDLPTQDHRGYWVQMYADIRELLFDAMRPDARQTVSAHFEAYLDAAQNQPFTPCLRHGDFGPSNMLYDPKTLTLQGVLDFSSAALGDPAVDLSSLSCYGNDFLQAAMQHYPATEAMLARARFYYGTFALQEALAGAKLHDPRAYNAGMAKYI